MKTVLLLGAHTAIARALEECIEEREVGLRLLRATTSDHLSSGLLLIDEAQMKTADLIVLAMPGALGVELAEAARVLGKPVFDLTESLADEEGAHFDLPGLDAQAGQSFDASRPAVLPIGLGVPVVTAIDALVDLGPKRAAVVTQESTAVFGQAGMDELSEQIRARFNMREAAAAVLPGTIGFGVVDSAAPPGEPAVDADDRLRAALEAGLAARAPELELFVSRLIVPTFSADSAFVLLDFDAEPDERDVRARLTRAKGLHVAAAAEVVSSSDAVGRDDALVGRIQVEGVRVGLWLACDRLRRGSATLAALALERFAAGG